MYFTDMSVAINSGDKRRPLTLRAKLGGGVRVLSPFARFITRESDGADSNDVVGAKKYVTIGRGANARRFTVGEVEQDERLSLDERLADETDETAEGEDAEDERHEVPA